MLSPFQLVLRVRVPDPLPDDAGRDLDLGGRPRHLRHPQGAPGLHRPTGRKITFDVLTIDASSAQ